MPRYVLLIQASPESESGAPSKEVLSQMATYNAELHSAGVLLGGEGLLPTSRESYRLNFTRSTNTPANPADKQDLTAEDTKSQIDAAKAVEKTATHADVKSTKGPFDVVQQPTVAGWWILRCKDGEEALGWAKKIPMTEGAVELRRIAEETDFGEAFTEEMREDERKMREEVAGRS
jgi:hypothetical protein